MRGFNTLLFVLFALSANAADGTVGTVSVQKENNLSVNGEAPVSLTLDGKDPQSCQFLSKRAPDENHEFTWKEVTTTRGGELAEILGDQKEEIDSLVINGPVNSADFETLFHSSLYGYLSAINLKGAELENNAVPAYAFYRDGEQHQGETFYYIHLRRIILPENVERIGNSAFYQALALRELNFPSSLRSVGDYAFYNTPIRMNPLVLPEGSEKIGANAFCHCGKLSEVILPSTIKQIGDEAFSTTKISSVNLPEGLESIGWRAFWDTSLKEVSIPNSCLNFGTDYVGENFAMNRYLEKIHLPEGMTEIPYGFVCNDIMLREINIPHTVKHIGKRALAQCTSLKRLEFPLGMQSLGEGALGYLDSLECIVFRISRASSPNSANRPSMRHCPIVSGSSVRRGPHSVTIPQKAVGATPGGTSAASGGGSKSVKRFTVGLPCTPLRSAHSTGRRTLITPVGTGAAQRVQSSSPAGVSAHKSGRPYCSRSSVSMAA